MEELMLFPLNTILLPGATVPLHIFEPRYRTMVRVCLREHKSFGIVLIKGGPEVGGPATPHPVGVEAKILAWQELDEGRYNLVTEGGRRFEIVELDHSHPYLTARVRELADTPGARPLDPGERQELIGAVPRPPGTWPSAGKSIDPETLADLPDAELTWAIAESLPVPPALKQPVLEATSPAERARQIRELLAGLEREAPRPAAG
jgi:hypothetical protein